MQTQLQVKFFQGKNAHFITSIVLKLKLEVYAPGDTVVEEGEAGTNMYFVLSGRVAVQTTRTRTPRGSSHSAQQASKDAPAGSSSPATASHNARMFALASEVLSEVDSREYPASAGVGAGAGGLASRQTIVDTLGVGQHFGEISLITGRRRCASVVSTEPYLAPEQVVSWCVCRIAAYAHSLYDVFFPHERARGVCFRRWPSPTASCTRCLARTWIA